MASYFEGKGFHKAAEEMLSTAMSQRPSCLHVVINLLISSEKKKTGRDLLDLTSKELKEWEIE